MNEKISSVGAGLTRRSWAIVCARAGFAVGIHDRPPEALRSCQKLLRENLDDLALHGLLSEAVETVLSRVTWATTLADALEGAVLVQENVRESLDAKKAIFAELDYLAAPKTILASSTSWIAGSSFSAGLAGRVRTLVSEPVATAYL